MVKICCIKECGRKGIGVSLFSVPKGTYDNTKCSVTMNLLRKRRQAWLEALGINKDANRAYHVCSNHFVSGNLKK